MPATSAHRTKEDTIRARVFVGNLSFDTTQPDLEKMFGEVGELVEVFLPTDRTTGRPRGFAFVEFANEAAAEAAIGRFNDAEVNGRKLRVSRAEERVRQPRIDFASPPSLGWGREERAKPKGSRRGLRARKRSL